MGPVLVIATINLAAAVLTEATLSFLGVGMPPTYPSLGTLIRIGNEFVFSGIWWIALFPALLLVLLVLGVNIVGDWLRDRFNPEAAGRADEPARPILALDAGIRGLRSNTRCRTAARSCAVEDASLTIAPGEIHALVGESGAGKTTIGNAVLGLLEKPGRIASGTIALDGKPFEPARGRRRASGSGATSARSSRTR